MIVHLCTHRVTWIQVEGVMYKPGGIVVLEMKLVPTFGIIKDLICLDVDNFYIILEKLHTEIFNPHYHAYEISYLSREYSIISPAELPDSSVLSMYKKEQSHFVPLKYSLVENV